MIYLRIIHGDEDINEKDISGAVTFVVTSNRSEPTERGLYSMGG